MLFPWYTKYPYQNDEVLNLDWVLRTIDNLVKEVANFVTLNTIKYADPIQWNITTQYEKNTVVIDPISGSAYISSKPVPAGVGLNNTDYWNIIFTLDVISANKNITLRDDANNMLATFESEIGDWLLWQGTLYVVTRNIEIGQAYTEDYNIERTTVEYFLKLYINNLKDYVDSLIGDLDNLNTIDKDNLVEAINSLLSALGDITELTTEDKDSAVDAINELVTSVGNLSTLIGNLDDLTTSDKDSIVDAINELVTSIGDLSNLDTTDKDSLVNAINEIKGDLDNLDVSQVFYDIAEMVASDVDFETDEIIITTYPAYAAWKVVDSATANTFNKLLANSKYASYLADGTINIASLGALPNSDISSLISDIIAEGYKDIYIPEGVYIAAITLTNGVHLSGAGIGLTSITPKSHTYAININGSSITLENLTIQDVSPYTANGITTGANGCNNNHFRNIHIENCNNGFLGSTSMIWNEFINCDFYGCMNNGFVVTGGSIFCNNNSFISCKFNNNVNEGCVLSLTETYDYGNVFVACNFEYNAQDRFGKTHTATSGFQNTSFASLFGCYFEGNGTENTDSAILNYDRLLIAGCCFINEKYIITNNTGGGNVGSATFVSCKHLNLTSGVSRYTNTKCVCINNTFDVPDGALSISLDKNKKNYQVISAVTVDCSYTVTVNNHNAITTLTNTTDGQIIYIKAGSYAVAISSSCMLNGTALSIPAGECFSFLVYSGKLVKIT